jgi:hypothetical protein
MSIFETLHHFDQFVRTTASFTSDAAGNGEVTLDPVPAGRLWLVERVTFFAAGVTAGTFLVFRNSNAATNLEDVTPQTALRWTFVEWPPIAIDQQESLVLRAEGIAVTTAVRCRIQARQMIPEYVCYKPGATGIRVIGSDDEAAALAGV